jgi:hypothetical protein
LTAIGINTKENFQERWLMKRKHSTLALSVVILAFTASCQQKAEDYYPLKEGQVRTYRAKAKGPQGVVSGELTITNMAPRKLNGTLVTPQRIDGEGKGGFSFIAVDKTGLYEIGSQSPEDMEPKLLQSPSYTIKLPIQVGGQWQGTDEVGSDGGFLQAIPVTVKCTIEKLDDLVTVPAGTFKALKVTCRGSGRKEMQWQGMCDGITENHLWYASGVGVVKSFNSQEIRRSSVVLYNLQEGLELVSIKK